MGITDVEIRIGASASKTETVRMLVDSGAQYYVLPQPIWKRLGIEPTRSMTFYLADGSHLDRKIGEALFSYRGIRAHSPVVLGQRGDQALLGAVTLENLVMVLNPFSRTLHPMKMLMTR